MRRRVQAFCFISRHRLQLPLATQQGSDMRPSYRRLVWNRCILLSLGLSSFLGAMRSAVKTSRASLVISMAGRNLTEADRCSVIQGKHVQ
jgi:hypothetical protein